MKLVDGGFLHEKVKKNVVEKQLLVWFQQTVNYWIIFIEI
jgi:hypothetical protein